MIYTIEELTTFDEGISGDRYLENLDSMVDDLEITDGSEIDGNAVSNLER